jgi:DNA-binding NarL/FixJ family response regulator
MKDLITILIVDSHPSVRSGLRALIETVPGMEVIGDTNNCETAVAIAHTFKPEIVILDTMPAWQNGIGIIRALRRASPESKILILTDNDNSVVIVRAIQEGARGYLLKDPLSADIASAIYDILDGKLVLHYGVAKILKEKHLEDLGQSSAAYETAPAGDFEETF